MSKMKLHGSVVPHRKDIDELRDTSKKEVRKDVKDEDTSIYEYRNGTVWWSRETNSTILNSSAAVAHEVAATGKKKKESVEHALSSPHPGDSVISRWCASSLVLFAFASECILPCCVCVVQLCFA